MSKKKHKKLIKFAIFIVLDIIIILTVYKLMVARPKTYLPNEPLKTNEVSPYLTHALAEDFFNGISKGDEFEITITQEGINDILRRQEWPLDLGNFILHSASISFTPKGGIVMGRLQSEYLDTIVTAEININITDSGQMQVGLGQIKAGKLPIRYIVMPILKKSAEENLMYYPEDAIEQKIADSVFESIPFEPEFELGDGTIEIKEVVFGEKFVKIGIDPAKFGKI